MKFGKFLIAAIGVVMLSAGTTNADVITNVTASNIDIVGFFNTTGLGALGNDRSTGGGGVGDHLLGNSGGTAFRNLVATFDPSSYLTLANDPLTTLTSAQLVMTENGNDTTSGTANIFAYFSNEANGGISLATPNNGNQGATAGTTGFFGNTSARRGPFGGPGGADNIGAAYSSGVSSVAHTFVTGVDTITIDLTAGGISLADIQTALADDGTSNAGIFLDSPFTSQIRLRDNFALNLAFNTVTVPEPSSLALLGLAGVFVGARRRR